MGTLGAVREDLIALKVVFVVLREKPIVGVRKESFRIASKDCVK